MSIPGVQILLLNINIAKAVGLDHILAQILRDGALDLDVAPGLFIFSLHDYNLCCNVRYWNGYSVCPYYVVIDTSYQAITQHDMKAQRNVSFIWVYFNISLANHNHRHTGYLSRVEQSNSKAFILLCS